MKIAIIGASGFVGHAITDEALTRQHDVTAIVRSGNNLTAQPGLTITKGDIHDIDWLATVLRPVDAVISAYNPGWTETDLREKFVTGSKQIIQAVKNVGQTRLLIIGGAGSLNVAPDIELVDTPAFPEEWRQGALGARDIRNLLKADQSLDWSYLSPAAMLEPGQRSGQFRLGGTDLLMNADNTPARISVQDLAVAAIDELEKLQHIRQQFTAAY